MHTIGQAQIVFHWRLRRRIRQNEVPDRISEELQHKLSPGLFLIRQKGSLAQKGQVT